MAGEIHGFMVSCNSMVPDAIHGRVKKRERKTTEDWNLQDFVALFEMKLVLLLYVFIID